MHSFIGKQRNWKQQPFNSAAPAEQQEPLLAAVQRWD
jgi:hypothetical protein